MRTGVVPWHMWGDSKVVETESVGAGTGVPAITTQITRINYLRPETWHWNWRVDILEANHDSGAGGSLVVVLDVITGVGRASHSMRIGKFVFAWGAGPIPTEPSNLASKWATAVNGPLPDDTIVVVPATTPLQNFIDHFVGQDIQVQASSNFFEGSDPSIKLKYRVTALFSPETHVRPEWFEQVGRFEGEEDGGRK